MNQFLFNSRRRSLPPSRKGIKINRRKIGQERQEQLQESYEPQFRQAKRMGLSLEGRVTRGNWNLQESKIYLKYVIDHLEDFIGEVPSRKKKAFHDLSKLLKKRTPDQCRSHHQKLQQRYGSMTNIIDHVKKKIAKKMKISVEEKNSMSVQQFKCGNGSNFRKTGTSEQSEEDWELVIDMNELAIW